MQQQKQPKGQGQALQQIMALLGGGGNNKEGQKGNNAPIALQQLLSQQSHGAQKKGEEQKMDRKACKWCDLGECCFAWST